MTQAEKLEALVEKATVNGWSPDRLKLATSWEFGKVPYTIPVRYNILFDHDFARALFGVYPTYVTQGFERYDVGKDVKSWLGPAKEAIKDESFVTEALTYRAFEYHTMQAVISKDPIDYMYGVVFERGLSDG